MIPSVNQLSDRDLLAQVQRAADGERHATAHLIALLMELDTRKLYLAEGCSSTFTYCTQVLHLSEHAAYLRIEAARAARRFPIVLERLADGSINLTALSLLAPHLTEDNHREVLGAARRKRKSDIEQIVARLRPLPDVPATVRKLPERKPPSATEHPIGDSPFGESMSLMPRTSPVVAPPFAGERSAEVKPLAPERYKVQFTVSRETYERLRHAQDLLRHTIPNGDPAAIFERALALLVAELEKTRLAATKRPQASSRATTRSRHIPASIKRLVWQRDGGQCAFKGTRGRCTETGFLEFHHVVPFAAGGATSADNLALRCKAHNSYEAEQYFGPTRPTLLREACDPFGLEA